MRDAESILEDILSQLEKQTGAIGQQTANDMRQAVKESKSQKQQNSQMGGELLGDAANNLKALNNSSSTVADAMPVMGKGFKGLGLKILPGFGTAIGLAADAAEAFYNYMNDSLNVYKSFNASGIQTTDGMLGLTSALAGGRLTADEFQNAIADTRDVLASMGADGTREFGSMVNTLIEAQKQQGYLNLTNEQMAKYIASNLKQQKAYGVFDKLNRAEQDASNREYVQRMSDMSKALGISTDQLVDNMNKNVDSVQGFGTALALQNRGMEAGTAADTTNTLNSVLGSFGQFGDQFGEQFARFLEYGQVDLESPVGQMYQTSSEIQNLFNNMRDMALSGELATEEGAKALQGMLSKGGLVKDIDQSIGQIRAAFGDQAANQVIAMRNQLNNYNTEVAKVDDFWNGVINDFNTTIEGFFFSFKKGTADLFLTSPRDLIVSMFGEKWGNWLLDGAFNWEMPEVNMNGSVVEFMKTFFKPVAWFWDVLQGYGTGVADQLASKPPSWQNILRALVPDWLYDIVMDENGNLNSAGTIANNLAETTAGAAGAVLEEGSKYIGEYTANLKDAVSDVSSEMYKMGSEMFGSVSDWFGGETTNNYIEKTVTPMIAEPVVNILEPAAEGFADKLANVLDTYEANVGKVNTEQVDLLKAIADKLDLQNEATREQTNEVRKGNKSNIQIN